VDKVTKKIKTIGLSLFIWASSLSAVWGQESYDLNGIFEGEHVEFSIDDPNDSSVYFYKFDLVQDSKRVTGKSFIYNDDGYYAVVQLRGLLIENEFYFEEFGTIDEINPAINHWCYNSGHLSITEEDDKIRFQGFTKSYTKKYGAFCRSGYTNIFKVREPDPNQYELISDDYYMVTNLILNPNPTRSETTLNFELLEDAWTILEVRDLQGELILETLNRRLLEGAYSFPIDLSFQPDGMYIVELIVDRTLYTKELWKGKF
jgi:hypothetical protein